LRPPVFLVRLDPAADRRQALEISFPGTVVEQVLEPDIENLTRVSYLSGLLATVMALLA
jgi:hypothetical protein